MGINVPNITTNTPQIPNLQVNGTGIRFIRTNHFGGVRGIFVRDVQTTQIQNIRPWMNQVPNVQPLQVPVTTLIGTPIVDVPGCVKVNKENAKNPPNKNNQLVNDDPKQNVVLCDGGMPYYEPPNYDARELTWQTITTQEEEAEGLDTGEPPAPDIDAPSPPVTPPQTAKDIECPEPNAQRIGDLSQSGKERVKGFKLSVDKKVCIKEWEDVPFIDAYFPSPAVITTTAGIAAVATTSALLAKPLADLLLKVVKPAVKKVIAKIQKMTGKTPRKPTLQEKRTDQYREKKGLLPLKKGR